MHPLQESSNCLSPASKRKLEQRSRLCSQMEEGSLKDKRGPGSKNVAFADSSPYIAHHNKTVVSRETTELSLK